MKIYTNELGHITNMAAMPIYGKNLKKSSSPEPIDCPVGTRRRFNVEAWLKFRRDVVSTLIQR